MPNSANWWELPAFKTVKGLEARRKSVLLEMFASDTEGRNGVCMPFLT